LVELNPHEHRDQGEHNRERADNHRCPGELRQPHVANIKDGAQPWLPPKLPPPPPGWLFPPWPGGMNGTGSWFPGPGGAGGPGGSPGANVDGGGTGPAGPTGSGGAPWGPRGTRP